MLRIAGLFERFCKSLKFSDEELEKIRNRYHSITKRINEEYWSSTSNVNHSLYVGSYGRDTEIFASDIDMLVQLPYLIYEKYDNYSVNGQSHLLQDVKNVIKKTYPNTRLKADGQIISVTFSDGINFEVLPAFLNKDGSYTFANSNDGGKWRITDPKSEIDAVNTIDNQCNKNLKQLCKMIRTWKQYNNVDISGILIDILACRFLSSWEYKEKSYLYYDWMSRDFFKYLSEIPVSQCSWKAMGSGRYIVCFGDFQKKAKEAYEGSIKAINYEENNQYLAIEEWRKIYGNKFPRI